MNFNLRAPCKDCPFRTDCLKGWLGKERAAEIALSITKQDMTFSCHKTNDFSDDEVKQTQKTEHCAGAMIMLEKIKRPNQLMRIAERLHLYDYTKLKMDSPVFNNPNDFIKHHT